MDPEACVQRIFDACGEGPVEMDEFLEACEDLAGWLVKGGFAPKSLPDINSSMLLLLRMHNRDAADVIAKAQAAA
jgi:hypothetical protein